MWPSLKPNPGLDVCRNDEELLDELIGEVQAER